ncbi:MAG: biotin--[acetyl-CoA-carboxylase] ligase [bacterium]
MKNIHLESVSSTNTYVKDHVGELDHFTYVSADHQTAGRGRLGRNWNDGGASALFSILIKDGLTVERLESISLIAAVAVHKTLTPLARRIKIKWPNDIVTHYRKMAGILVESVIEDNIPRAAIVGIGVNVNEVAFPDGLESIATSVLQESGRKTAIAPLIGAIAAAFAAEWEGVLAGTSECISYCNRHSALKGEQIFFVQNGIRQNGIAGRMMPDGSLKVKTKQGTLFLKSGEVTISGGMRLPSE